MSKIDLFERLNDPVLHPGQAAASSRNCRRASRA